MRSMLLLLLTLFCTLLSCSVSYTRLFAPTHSYRLLSMSGYDTDSLSPESAFSSTGEDLVWQGLRKDAFEGYLIMFMCLSTSMTTIYVLFDGS